MTDYKKWQQIEDSIPEDEEDKARQRLRQQKDDMSDQEVRRLHECWEQPEFKTMFHEYAEEVSDPAHRAESEKYLAQCEAEQRAERDAKNGYLNGRSAAEFDSLKSCVPGQPDAPEGSQLLKPHKGFVVKTWKKQAGRADFDRELGKVFINVCSHEEIDKPTATDVTAPDGRKGQTWSMPHLCSPAVKEEQDRAGHKCTVIDIVFNTEVLRRIEAPNGYGERWKEMVAKTALDMVSKLHQIELDMAEYKLLNTKYYGDTGEGPSTLAWKPGSAFEEKELPSAKRSPKSQAAQPTPPTPQPSQPTQPPTRSAAAPTAGGGGGTPTPTPTPSTTKSSGRDGATQRPPPASRAAPAKKGPTAPKYSVVHRGVGDMGATWSDAKLSSSGRPRELCVKVELPELSSAADIDLDITERKLELRHEGAAYALSLPLPYSVLSEQGSAKFDKAKRVLTITLPVAAAAAPMPVWQPKEQGQTDEERAAEEAAEKAAEKAARAAAEATEAERREAERAARAAKAKQEEEDRAARQRAAIAQAEREAAKRAAKQTSAARPSVPKPAAPKPAAPKPAEPAAPKPAAPKAEKQEKARAAPTVTVSDQAEHESEWVEVSDAEAADAKAASPAKTRPDPPGAKEAKKAPASEPPAAPTGKSAGLPAFSNELLFELD